jgi:hypothetical protein
VDFNKIQIPQADEQQRLLVNLILQMNAAKKPLPRFWYFPRGLQAVVIMTGDDHGTYSGYPGGATAPRFDQYIAASPASCNVANWECVRASSYLFPPWVASNSLTDAPAASYIAQGFEVAIHNDSSPDCTNWTPSVLNSTYTASLASFASTYPSVPASQTHRQHCVSWSDYDSQPQAERAHGIRLDTTYYYWPPTWVNDRPGLFTGSGMPMRFTTRTGSVLDIYQATTQMTDESGQTYPSTVDTLLSNALGYGFYGAFTANMHNDAAESTGANDIIASAQKLGVPIVSSVQMLHWLDGRNGSSFSGLIWDGSTLSFQVSVAAGAENWLEVMLPANSAAGRLFSVTFNGTPVGFALQTIKGMQYGIFTVNSSGSLQASYRKIKVTGSGQIASQAPALRANFGFAANSNGPVGSLSYHDDGAIGGSIDVKSVNTSVPVMSSGNCATFNGAAKVNQKTGYSYSVKACDYAEPGVGKDTFFITVTGPSSFYYSNGGTLTGGNIQIQNQ